MSENLRIGVVGFGHWGPNHARVFQGLAGAELVGIVEPGAARRQLAESRFPGVPIHTNLESLLDGARPDAVAVATPTTTHAAVVGAALERGVHVLCEKPLCPDAGAATALAELARRKGVVLMVGHIFLFNRAIQRLRHYLDEDELGALRYLSFQRTNLGPMRADASGTDGGASTTDATRPEGHLDVVWDLAAHDVSIANYLVGESPVEVSAVGQGFLQGDTHEVAFANLRYRGGVIAHIHVSWLEAVKTRHLTVVGAQKMATFDDLGRLGPIHVYDRGVVPQRDYESFGDFQLLIREGDLVVPRIQMDEPLVVQAEHFLEAVRGADGYTSGADFSVGVVRVLEAIAESAGKRGAPISLGTP